jgi:protein-disulfide isomerase
MAKKQTRTYASRREVLRQQQEDEQRRHRLVRALIVAAVVIVVVALVAVFVSVHNNRVRNAAINGDPTAQIKPPDLTPDGSAIVANPAADGAALTLDIHMDYQCPDCKMTEDAIGKALDQIVADNDALVRYHIRTFVDGIVGNDSSVRAAIAATCADTVGKFMAYHDTVFANQPSQEGVGYTDQQLSTDFAAQAGITGDDLTKFQTCYNNRQTSDVVQNMETINDANTAVKGTPTFFANGKVVDLTTIKATDTASVLAAFKSAAGLK